MLSEISQLEWVKVHKSFQFFLIILIASILHTITFESYELVIEKMFQRQKNEIAFLKSCKEKRKVAPSLLARNGRFYFGWRVFIQLRKNCQSPRLPLATSTLQTAIGVDGGETQCYNIFLFHWHKWLQIKMEHKQIR